MPRTKKIELDGAEFTIAPLTLCQVEEFLEQHRDALGLDDKGDPVKGRDPDPKKLRSLWRNFICTGLNNANRDAGWTADKIGVEIDLVSFERLRTELLNFSGLKSDVEEKKIPELAAAAAS